MTSTPQAPAIHRRFRFGLRTLLAMVTLPAVASWVYWVGWPWWQAYHEQAGFEAAVRQLKLDDPTLANGSHLPSLNNDSMYSSADPQFTYIAGKYIRSNFSYCIIFKARNPTAPFEQYNWLQVSAYRLHHAPVDYRAYRDHDYSSFKEPTSNWLREIKYVNDFADFILGDSEDGRQFQYELIYSDPPAKPELK